MSSSIPDHIGSKLSAFDFKRTEPISQTVESELNPSQNAPIIVKKKNTVMAKKKNIRKKRNGQVDDSIDTSYIQEVEENQLESEMMIEESPVEERKSNDPEPIIADPKPKEETKEEAIEGFAPENKRKIVKKKKQAHQPKRINQKVAGETSVSKVDAVDPPVEKPVNTDNSKLSYREKIREEERLARIERQKYLDDLSEQTKQFLKEVRQEYNKK